MSAEPCFKCDSVETGPAAATPYGICEACACEKCRGFRYFDDRGSLCAGQPFFDKTPCPACQGEGLRTPHPIPKGDK